MSAETCTRVAAVGDLHLGTDCRGCFRQHFDQLAEQADVLLLAGDLTRVGTPVEAAVVADELAGAPVPVVAVLGNHDHHADEVDAVVDHLMAAGVCVLEGDATHVDLPGGRRLGIAGSKGFGGGFQGACGSDFGELEMKSFVGHTRAIARRLGKALASVDADHRVVLLHYSPVAGTLFGERPEIYPFLGSYLLAEAIDGVGADLVLHGHAHSGVEKGTTPLGTPVRNVAQPVLGAPFKVYQLDGSSPA